MRVFPYTACVTKIIYLSFLQKFFPVILVLHMENYTVGYLHISKYTVNSCYNP